MPVKKSTNLFNVNYERKSMSPLHISVIAEAENRNLSVQQFKEKINSLDIWFREKKDPLRCELYMGINKFFQVYPGDYRLLLDDISDESYEEFLKPRKGFEKLKRWDKLNKIQKILQYAEARHQDNRAVLYSMAGSLNLVYAAKEPNKHRWTTYRLSDEVPSAYTTKNQHTAGTLGTFVKSKIGKALEKLEDVSAREEDESHDLFYVHRKVEDDFIFIGIRKQVSPNPDSPKLRNGKRLRVISEKAETLNIMFRQNFPHFFTSGSMNTEVERLILQVLVKALGYKNYSNQNLSGTDLRGLVQSCEDEYIPAVMEEVEKEFLAEEEEMASKRIFFGSRKLELNQRYQIAEFRSIRKENRHPEPEVVGTKSRGRKPTSTETICFSSSLGKCIMKVKGTHAEMDDHIVECYERGIISDLTPYINLKKEQANHCHLEE